MTRENLSTTILRKFVLDVLLLFAMAVCIFATGRLWKPFQRGFFCDDESLMYPYGSDTVTVTTLRLFGLGLPFLVFLICEWKELHNIDDNIQCLGVPIPSWVRGLYCTLVSFGVGLCFTELTTNITKVTIGRPRPHFLAVCQPSINCSSPEFQNRYVQAHEFECTGSMADHFKDIRLSFLSGHSSWSAYTMIYLALYLEKRMTWRGTRIIRHVMQFGIILISWFTALSRVSDYKHHWSDVLAGYSLGLCIAIVTWNCCTDLVYKKKRLTTIPNHQDTVLNHRAQNEQPA